MRKYGIWLFIGLFFVLYSIFSIVKHLRFETNIFDLGYYDQIVWLASKGYPLYSSLIEAHTWTDHFSPTILLLAPLYKIWASPIWLLLAQSIIVCLGGYPIFALAFKKTKHYALSLLFAVIYLSFYGIQNALAYEFHPFTLGAPLLGWLFYLYETKKFRWFWIVLVLFIGLQENFFLLAAALGLFLILRHHDYRRGVVVILGSILSLLFLLFVFIPRLGLPYSYLPRHLDNKNIVDLVALLFSPISKIQVVLISFLAFGFFPILSLSIMPMLLEEFIGRFVGTPNTNRWVLLYQYNATLAPILAYGAMDSIKRFLPKYTKIVFAVLTIGSIASLVIAKPEIKRLFTANFYDLSGSHNNAEIIKLVPHDASLAATNNLGGHLSQRTDLIFFTNCKDNTAEFGNDGRRCFHITPDYIVADLSEGSGSNNYYPDYSKEALESYLRYLQESHQYSLIAKIGDSYLYKQE